MRVVRPITRPISEIDNLYSSSAWWGLMCCIVVSLLIIFGFSTAIVTVVAQREENQIKAAVHACREIENTTSLADCIRAAK